MSLLICLHHCYWLLIKQCLGLYYSARPITLCPLIHELDFYARSILLTFSFAGFLLPFSKIENSGHEHFWNELKLVHPSVCSSLSVPVGRTWAPYWIDWACYSPYDRVDFLGLTRSCPWSTCPPQRSAAIVLFLDSCVFNRRRWGRMQSDCINLYRRSVSRTLVSVKARSCRPGGL